VACRETDLALTNSNNFKYVLLVLAMGKESHKQQTTKHRLILSPICKQNIVISGGTLHCNVHVRVIFLMQTMANTKFKKKLIGC
jgi:hypothetical protein